MNIKYEHDLTLLRIFNGMYIFIIDNKYRHTFTIILLDGHFIIFHIVDP